MSFRPCLTCGARIWGGAFYSYLTWYDGETRVRFRLVECGSCASDRRNSASETGDAWVDDDWVIATRQLPVDQLVTLPATSSNAPRAPGGAKPLLDGGKGSLNRRAAAPLESDSHVA